MGQLAKQAQEIQQAGGSRTFSDLVKACAPQLQSVMPKGFKAERLTQMAIAAYKTTPKLSECSVPSILSCCLQCATLGLEPSAVEAWAAPTSCRTSTAGRRAWTPNSSSARTAC